MTKTLRKFTLTRSATDTVSTKIRFGEDFVPECCGEPCPHHDGKRCALTGEEPERVCRPACAKLVKALMVLDHTILG